MKLHDRQREIAQSDARFKVIRAGRRSGKSTVEVETMLYKAVTGKDRTVFYIAPTQIQARSIIWEALKRRASGLGDVHEQRLEMTVPTKDGGTSMIKIAGWENRENFRGQSAYHITFDETDTMKDFFIGLQEIFMPALIDTQGTADFIGTPQKENPNLRRLEKYAENKHDWECFHFTSWDNPLLDRTELEKWKEEMDKDTYRQEILAEYVDNLGALFKYTALIDLFSNTITKSGQKYLTIDIAEDGSDKTVFAFWDDLELYRMEVFERLNTETIVSHIRDYASLERIPYSHIAVDAIGIGAGVASSSLLDGIVAYKSSHQAFKTDIDPVRLPNVHYTKDAPLISEYKNLRSQCVFTLAQHVNDHNLAVKVEDTRIKEAIIEELSTYQDASPGDGKRTATKKEDVKAILGRSPDITDTLIMRMYFVLRERLLPNQSEQQAKIRSELLNQFDRNFNRQESNSTR